MDAELCRVELITRRSRVALQLSTPQTTEVAVHVVIVITESSGIDGEAVWNGFLIGDEWSFRLIADGYTETEDAYRQLTSDSTQDVRHTFVILCRETQVVLSVLALEGIRRP